MTDHPTDPTRTVAFYDAHAQELAARYEALRPETVTALLERWTPKGARVLEVGCGTGREARRLAERGADVLATDASEAMLEEARRTAAGLPAEVRARLEFRGLVLPVQAADEASLSERLGRPLDFDLILACGVLEHFSPDELYLVVRGLVLAAAEQCVFVVSVPLDHPQTDARLYSNLPAEHYAALFERFSFIEAERRAAPGGPPGSESEWVTFVFIRRSGDERARMNIQGLLETDAKTTTYKFALLRALADVNCANAGRVRHLTRAEMAELEKSLAPAGAPPVALPHQAALPLGLVVERVIAYYWQIYGRRFDDPDAALPPQIGAGRKLAFEAELLDLMTLYQGDWVSCREDFMRGALDGRAPERRRAFAALAKKMMETLVKGPVRYSGGSLGASAPELTGHRLFNTWGRRRWAEALAAPDPFTPALLERACGELLLPSELWRSLTGCAPWLADAVLLRWAAQSAAFTANALTTGEILERMLPAADARDVAAARSLYLAKLPNLRCVWSGQSLTVATLAVDHMIPWARTHTNDLWNLMPADAEVNCRKSDAVPSVECIEHAAPRILKAWRLFEASSLRPLFRTQAAFSLTGRELPDAHWETPLMDAVLRSADETRRQFACRTWEACGRAAAT